jgi:hypothetical protein
MKSLKWPSEKVLSFPKRLQEEILDEIPKYDKDFDEYINTWKLESDEPVFVLNEEILKNNIDLLERTPQKYNDIININWGINVKTIKIVDTQDLERHGRYAKMPKETALPSVMIDNSISFGSARCIASLMRKDEGLWVWKIKTK